MDKASSQKGLLSNLKIEGNLPVEFWTYLGPVSRFFFLISPFYNRNSYLMPVTTSSFVCVCVSMVLEFELRAFT
jgi:hypothetical protein